MRTASVQIGYDSVVLVAAQNGELVNPNDLWHLLLSLFDFGSSQAMEQTV
jgi:hypothetical protein